MALLKTSSLNLLGFFLLLQLTGCQNSLLSFDPKNEEQVIKESIKDHYSGITKPIVHNNLSNDTLSGLDKYSKILKQKEYETFMMDTTGEYYGYGIMLFKQEEKFIIFQVMEGGSADQEKLEQGDLIVSINGKKTESLKMSTVTKILKNPKHNNVVFQVKKPTSNIITTHSLKKNTIILKSVKSRLLPQGILYIRISTFDVNAALLVKKALHDYAEYNAIILDLRNNPGGLLYQSVDIADMFLDDAIIVSKKSKNKKHNMVFKAHNDNTITKVPVAVLVNKQSASASEVLAGALQDNTRAIIIGEKTLGKGTVQDTIRLGKQKLLKLTVANYYLPSGRSVQSQGIIPQIIIKEDKKNIKVTNTFKGNNQLKKAFDVLREIKKPVE